MKSPQLDLQKFAATLQKSSAVAQRQAVFLEVYPRVLFNMSEACRQLGITRTAVYKWLNDPEFKAKFEDCKAEKLDFIEDALLQKIKKGDTIATIFAAKCLLKGRGYVEAPQRHELSFAAPPKEAIDASVRAALEARDIAGQLNFTPEQRELLKLPAPQAPGQTPAPGAPPVEIQPEDPQPATDDPEPEPEDPLDGGSEAGGTTPANPQPGAEVQAPPEAPDIPF